MHVVHRSSYKVGDLNTSRNPARDDLLLRYRLTSDTVMSPSNGSDLSMAETAGAYEEGMQQQAKDFLHDEKPPQKHVPRPEQEGALSSPGQEGALSSQGNNSVGFLERCRNVRQTVHFVKHLTQQLGD